MNSRIKITIMLGMLVLLTACQMPVSNQSEEYVFPTNTATEALVIPESPTEEVEIPSTQTDVPPTPEPSETATVTPTETVAASETPTLEVTPTDEIPATPDPTEGLEGLYYNDPFDGSTGWGWAYVEEGVVRFGPEPGGVAAAFEEANQGWRISLGPDTVKIGDQRVEITTRAEVCNDRDEWGLLFRGTFTEENRFNGYLIKMNCSGFVRLEILEENTSLVLLDWTTIEEIEAGSGNENTLMVWVSGGEFRIYVNDSFVASVVDSTYESGQFGIFGQDRTTGTAKFLFMSLRVNEVKVE